MKSLYDGYKDKAVIVIVYIREAHPAAPSQTAKDAGWKVIKDVVYYQPKSYSERRKLAETACTFWEMPIPTLVDTMEPNVGETYQAWPNRIYVIDKEGKIAYRGPMGPGGVRPRDGEKALRALLALPQSGYVTPEDMGSGSGKSGAGVAGSKGAEGAPEGRRPPQR